MEYLLVFIGGMLLGVAVMWLAVSVSRENRVKITNKQIQSTLEPFRRDMENLQKSVTDSSKEKYSLTAQIEKIGSQANNLADALTHTPKIRGNWGEVVLQKMLEDSGLRQDKDYKLQNTLKGAENETLRPDVVLNLPEDKNIIIDSKLSLISYKNHVEEEKQPYKQNYLKDFYASTKKHIDALANKNYPNAKGIESPDFTIMFMPIEGAFISLMQGNSELQKYAWDKKIVLAAPSILFAMLQTVASLWRLNIQNKNAGEIARLGGSLYDKIAQFDSEMVELGNRLGRVHSDFEATHKKLSTGRGNILTRTETLREIGAKTTKKLNLDEESEL